MKKNFIIKHVGDWKIFRSALSNYNFNKVDGTMITWGRTKEEDPKFSEHGPFILDLEVSEVCNGIPDIGSSVATPCSFCYKANTKVGKNMSFETFKGIFDKLPQTLTQIAFGIGNLHTRKFYRKKR